MVEIFIAAGQALSLAGLIYGAYVVLLRPPQLARTPAKNAARSATEVNGERERD
jgi:hypothetical protein